MRVRRHELRLRRPGGVGMLALDLVEQLRRPLVVALVQSVPGVVVELLARLLDIFRLLAGASAPGEGAGRHEQGRGAGGAARRPEERRAGTAGASQCSPGGWRTQKKTKKRR